MYNKDKIQVSTIKYKITTKQKRNQHKKYIGDQNHYS